MDPIIDVIKKLTLLVPVLLALGAGWKYLPVLRKTTNEVVLPILNALVTFFVAFAPPAHAGIVGAVGKQLGFAAEVALSLGFAAFVGVLHDKYLKPWLPPSPYTAQNGQRIQAAR